MSRQAILGSIALHSGLTEYPTMNLLNKTVFVLLVAALGTGLAIPAEIRASDESVKRTPAVQPEKPGEKYLPSEDALADLGNALKAANENNKLTLVVMGANWCHDSRSLAKRLYQPPLSSVIEESYETVFIDVGYLEKGEDVITNLGVPVYYATPTVLIVDPVSGKLVNANNRHQWGNADSISMEDSLAYFQLMANTDLTALRSEPETSGQLQALLAEIDAFEQVQADRLYAAYAVLGPMLKAYKTEKKSFSVKDWNMVRDFRYKVPVDMDILRTEALQRVAAGEQDIHLTYPQYPAFLWEEE